MICLSSCSSFSTTTTIIVDSADVQGFKLEKVNKFDSEKWN